MLLVGADMESAPTHEHWFT